MIYNSLIDNTTIYQRCEEDSIIQTISRKLLQVFINKILIPIHAIQEQGDVNTNTKIIQLNNRQIIAYKDIRIGILAHIHEKDLAPFIEIWKLTNGLLD